MLVRAALVEKVLAEIVTSRKRSTIPENAARTEKGMNLDSLSPTFSQWPTYGSAMRLPLNERSIDNRLHPLCKVCAATTMSNILNASTGLGHRIQCQKSNGIRQINKMAAVKHAILLFMHVESCSQVTSV
jgi:hypothetical protein